VASKWDYLLDQKPVPLIDHLIEEVAKLLAKELRSWPPPLQSVEPEGAAAYAELLAAPSSRPSLALYEEAFRLTTWELERELAAYDDYFRNRRWLERGLAPADKPALLFLSRWLLEQMLGLAEGTEGRIKRAQLRTCLDATWRRFLAEERG
jgi:hypothetical protein